MRDRLPLNGYLIVMDTARPENAHYSEISKFYTLVEEYFYIELCTLVVLNLLSWAKNTMESKSIRKLQITVLINIRPGGSLFPTNTSNKQGFCTNGMSLDSQLRAIMKK